jgi:drug/metabolite transporter (DMT)-like permease
VNFENLKRHIAMLLVGLLYGANYSIMKTVTPAYLDAFGFLVLRVALASLFFIPLGLAIGEKINWRADGVRIFLSALFGVGINMLCFFKGLSLTTAINGSIIMTLTPIMVFMISVILTKEKIIKHKVIGLILGLSGVLLIIYKRDIQLSQGNWIGDVLIFINALSYGVYLVIVKPLLKKYKPITVAMWAFIIGFWFMLPFGWSEFANAQWSVIPFRIWLNIVYVILGATVIVYFINIWAMKKVNPSTVGAYIYVQPVFAMLIAAVFFGEVLMAKHLIAAILVFSGVWLVVKPIRA